MTKKQFNLQNFTNQYSLTKTLRFELKPVGKTKEYYKEILPNDKKRDKYYHKVVKPILDDLHNNFIMDSLKKVQFPLSDLEESEKKFLNNEEIDNLLKKLRNVVTASFDKTAEEWKKIFKQKYKIELKGKGGEILTCKEIFGTTRNKGLLEYLYKNNKEKLEAIRYFKGFSMYFAGFNENRKNYYSADEKQTAIAYRIVNQNFLRFIKNRDRFQKIIREIKDLEKFSSYFDLQNYQNILIQENIDEFNEKVIGEINYLVNLHNQKHKTRLPKLDVLYKQIGSPKKEKFIFEIEEGQEWEELKNLKAAQNKKVELNKEFYSLLPKLKDFYQSFFNNIDSFNLENIYFNKQSINTISSYWFVSWQTLSELLQIKPDKKTGEAKLPAQISLKHIKSGLEKIENVTEKENNDKETSLFAYFKKGKNGKWKEIIVNSRNAWQAFIGIWQFEVENNFKKIEYLENELEERAEKEFNKKEDGKFVKELCDAYLAIERMVKYHKVKENIFTDSSFYEVIDLYLSETELNRYYNAFRNYISKKPYSEDKVKLNFENSNLLGGWADGQEKNKGAVILKLADNKKEKYFLGILKNRSLFRTDKANPIYKEDSNWSRLILKKLDFKTLAGKGFKARFQKTFAQFADKEAVEKLQLFIKEKYLKNYPLLSRAIDKTYKSKKEFTNEVNKILKESFDMKFRGVDIERVMQAVENGELYLFEIYNKDYSENKESDSSENIHTKYWKTLFSKENLNNPIIALSANGEIFFRDGQLEKLQQRKDKEGQPMFYIDKRTGEKKKVLEHRRYAQDKILFHIPISINFKSPRNLKFNAKVNTEYLQRDKTKIIGIDRGEKHLIYISVIDQKGNIVEQKSLNILNVGNREVNFQKKLKQRASKMMDARKNWEEIGEIKNFKEGYLSYVIYEIYKLIEKHQAIVALEDLNTQFKLKRTAQVEYSLYKKFELALAKKLNHLIFKDKQADEVGGTLKGLQLTPKIEAGNISIFEKSKQWGILYYVRPNYTSITDPITGWRKHKHIANSATADKIKEFFIKEDIKINFDKDKDCFVFSYKHNGKEWRLYAYKNLIRFKYNSQKKEIERSDLYEEFNNLLERYKEVQNTLSSLEQDKKFSWKRLAYLWNLLNQIRNSDRDKEGNENDFLQSPVWSEKIQDFFDSRKVDEYKQKFGLILPENGDANGAYNIARKGLIVLQRQLANPLNKDLFVSDRDWDEFVVK